MNAKVIMVSLFLILFMSGCTNGPIRYKSLGHYKYASVELTKKSEPIIKPVAAIAGSLIDLTVIALDTPSNVISAIPLTFTHSGPDAAGCSGSVPACIVAPLWYPFTVIALNFWPKDMYQDIYGEETGVFRDIHKGKTPNQEMKADEK